MKNKDLLPKKDVETVLTELTKLSYGNLKVELTQWLNEEVETRIRLAVRQEVSRLFREMGRNV